MKQETLGLVKSAGVIFYPFTLEPVLSFVAITFPVCCPLLPMVHPRGSDGDETFGLERGDTHKESLRDSEAGRAVHLVWP